MLRVLTLGSLVCVILAGCEDIEELALDLEEFYKESGLQRDRSPFQALTPQVRQILEKRQKSELNANYKATLSMSGPGNHAPETATILACGARRRIQVVDGDGWEVLS